MSYDSFFEKRLYDSHMTHNICNIHIIWLEISFLIQWCKNFWYSPTQNFQMNFSPKCVGGIKISTSNSNSALNSASDSMWWYGVYIRFVSVFTEYSILRLRNQYSHANRRLYQYRPLIITCSPTQNFTLNSNLKSNFYSAHAFLRKNHLKILRRRISKFFAWLNQK